MTTIADQSTMPLWPTWVWAVILIACIVYVLWKLADLTHPLPTPRIEQAAPTQQVPRARTAPPALRVHLCTRLCGRPVARPGEACYPACSSPVHDAEQILRDAAGGA